MHRNPVDRRGRRYLVDPLIGRRLSESDAIGRVQELYDSAELAEREARKAYNRARRGAKLPETRERHRLELDFWRREVRQLTRAAERLQRDVLRTYPVELPRAPQIRREEVPREPREVARSAPREVERERETTAAEWELGVEYRPSPERRRRGKGWPVDVNIRVRRDDGKVLRRSEALNVLSYWVRTGVERQGYDIHAIDWRTPGKAWTTGDRAAAGDNLRGPIIEALDTQRFRLGAVDE